MLQAALLVLALLIVRTAWDLHPVHLSLTVGENDRLQVLDRNGVPLAVSYQNRFNTRDRVALHDVPPFLQQAFVASEDQQFFRHHGVDWKARFGAVMQNLRAGHRVRGASTITEQVVRILDPRPRTLWSRWLEGIEAPLLELGANKADILEFYLNQLPYASNRRGVVQAARYYFNRDLDTLSKKEMLALVVLPRAPSALDLYADPTRIEAPIARLAGRLVAHGEMTPEERDAVLAEKLALDPAPDPVNAAHFIDFIRETVPYRAGDGGVLRTTLDARLQQQVQDLLDERVAALARKHVTNGAALVVDHTTGEILAWAVVGANDAARGTTTPGRNIDAVRTPRQPGSAMKPFLYALALDSGWSPATVLDDAPYAEAVGQGLHDFHNYSHSFYGKVTLREALGNSLNIPALETIAFVTPERYLAVLHRLGFVSLGREAEFYKDGLALGNGEVTLYEMVQGYSALAHRGVFRPLTPLPQAAYERSSRRIYSDEAASLIGNILSDPYARRREFGAGSVLNLPVQTAVKTGTSTDYTDAWTMGFNARYAVGVWIGNLDRTPMDGITGSTGPALVLRAVFAELAGRDTPRALYMSPRLIQRQVCVDPSLPPGDPRCFPRTEYFMPGSAPAAPPPAATPSFALLRPTEGLQIAYDPRVPAAAQAFEFTATGVADGARVGWWLNGRHLATTDDGRYLWPVARGKYALVAKMLGPDDSELAVTSVQFQVK